MSILRKIKRLFQRPTVKVTTVVPDQGEFTITVWDKQAERNRSVEAWQAEIEAIAEEIKRKLV